MARDYARDKKPKKKAKRKASTLRALLTLIIAIGFAGGLWYLAQQPKDQAAPAPTEEPINTQVLPKAASPSTQAKAQKPAQPNKDNSNFDFYNLLPESQVQPQAVDAYKSTPKDPNKKTKTLLQAGSFRNLKDAERLRAKLILLNLSLIHI